MKTRLFWLYALIASFAFAIQASAATVLWDVMRLDGAWSDSGEVYQGLLSAGGNYTIPVSGGGGCVYPYLGLSGDFDGNSGIGEIRPVLSSVLEFGDNWTIVHEGDLIDASTLAGNGPYFMQGVPDRKTGLHPDSSDYPLVLDLFADESFFLGFAASVNYWDPDDPLDMVQELYYGWVQLSTGNGNLRIVHSAINTEGGGIYVGTGRTTAVPEPHAAALAFLGAGILAFGIRRRKAGTPPPSSP